MSSTSTNTTSERRTPAARTRTRTRTQTRTGTAVARARRAERRKETNVVVADTTNHPDAATTTARAPVRRFKIGPDRTGAGGHASFYDRMLATSLFPFSIRGLSAAETLANKRFTFHKLWYVHVTLSVDVNDTDADNVAAAGRRRPPQRYLATWPIKPRSRKEVKASDKWAKCTAAVRVPAAELVRIDHAGAGSGPGVPGSRYRCVKATTSRQRSKKAKQNSKKNNNGAADDNVVSSIAILSLDPGAASGVQTKGGHGARLAQRMTIMLANRPFVLEVATAVSSKTGKASAASRVRVDRFECVYENTHDTSGNVSKTQVVWCNGVAAVDTRPISPSFRQKLKQFPLISKTLDSQPGRLPSSLPTTAVDKWHRFQHTVLRDPFVAQLVTGDGGGGGNGDSGGSLAALTEEPFQHEAVKTATTARLCEQEEIEPEADDDDNAEEEDERVITPHGAYAAASSALMSTKLSAVAVQDTVMFGERRAPSLASLPTTPVQLSLMPATPMEELALAQQQQQHTLRQRQRQRQPLMARQLSSSLPLPPLLEEVVHEYDGSGSIIIRYQRQHHDNNNNNDNHHDDVDDKSHTATTTLGRNKRKRKKEWSDNAVVDDDVKPSPCKLSKLSHKWQPATPVSTTTTPRTSLPWSFAKKEPALTIKPPPTTTSTVKAEDFISFKCEVSVGGVSCCGGGDDVLKKPSDGCWSMFDDDAELTKALAATSTTTTTTTTATTTTTTTDGGTNDVVSPVVVTSDEAYWVSVRHLLCEC